MSHWWFPGTNVVQSSTADTHLVTLRSGFLWQEAALPQLPISQIGIHHTKFLQSQKIIPTEMWPKNQFINLLTPWLFVSQLINPLDSLSQRPERCFQQVKSSHSTHSSLCHIRTSLTMPFLHLHRHTPNISACNLEEQLFGPWSDGVQNWFECVLLPRLVN